MKPEQFGLHNQRVLDALSTLTPREQDVIIMRFGLADGLPRTLEEVGRTHKVTRERIRQIEKQAFEKMKGVL